MLGYNPYGYPQMNTQPQMPRMENPYQPYQPYAPQQPKPQGLQGKSVDNIDVVKATDIPLDGSISYFPIADGSAIVTKQLQADGTSKIIVYKPVDGLESPELPKYITVEEFNEAMKKIENNGYKDEIKGIKRQISDIKDRIEDLRKD